MAGDVDKMPSYVKRPMVSEAAGTFEGTKAGTTLKPRSDAQQPSLEVVSKPGATAAAAAYGSVSGG